MLSIFLIFNMFSIVFSQIDSGFSSIHNPSFIQSSPSSVFQIPLRSDISMIENPSLSSKMSNPLPVSGLAKATEVVTASKDTLTTVAKVAEGVCTRTQCYNLGDKIEQAASKIIMAETTREIDHASRVINLKFY